MNEILAQKTILAKTLIVLLARDRAMLKNTSLYSAELIDQITELTTSGKMFRGSLYLWMCHALGLKDTTTITPIAAAFELIQTGILIHDDIMDQDDLRRGVSTLHNQWAQKTTPHNKRFGENVAIAAGDICYFLAFSWIHQTGLSAASTSQLSDLLGKEYATVGLGQLDDISFGIITEPTQENILTMYRYKTARYTFSLPLMASCVTVGKPHLTLKVEQIGEHMGLAYQLRDDLVDLMHTSGKSTGSDIKENKYTLFKTLLFTKATRKEKDKLNHIFGNQKLKINDIEYVLSVAKQYGIIEEIQQLIQTHTDRALDSINTLPLSKNNRDNLSKFVRILATRTR